MSQQQFNGQGSIPGTPNIEFLEGNDSVPVGPDPATHILNLLGNTTQGVSVTNTAPFTETITVATSTTSQLGVVKLATNAQAIAGTDSANAVTSSALAAKLGTQTLDGIPYGNNTTGAIQWTTAVPNAVLVTSNANVPSLLPNGTVNFVLTANTGAPPSWQAVSVSGAITTIDGDVGSITPTAGVVTFTGGTTGLTFSGAVSTMTLGGTLALANGGTNASLTASDGGIFYSTATAGAILSGTATANQVLLSGSSTTPAWSTATYPATTTANQILYSSATNTISEITASANGVLITSNTDVPSLLANSSVSGYLLTATVGSPPSWQPPTTIAQNYTPVDFLMSPYTVLPTDYYISVDATGGAVTILLPNAPTTYQTFVVKDRLGQALVTGLTISTVGGAVLIDGSTSYTYTEDYEGNDILFNGTAYEIF